MSEKKQKVWYYDHNGERVEKEVDIKTKDAINKYYKSVYNEIKNYDIDSGFIRPRSNATGFVRRAIVAKSPDKTIVCTKEYIKNVPPEIDNAKYECGILDKKTGEFQEFSGGVPVLFYKFLNGRIR